MAKRRKLRTSIFKTQGVFLGVLLMVILVAAASLYYLAQNAAPPAAMCVDCSPGHIGGGCTYVDKTGNTVQPGLCVPYDATKTQHACTEESRLAQACIELYQPVCGNDGMTYSNSCFACMNEHVAFYLDGACDEIIGR